MHHSMRFLICLLAVVLCVSGCKKKIEAVQEDLLVKLIVDGQWTVTEYKKGSTDVTSGFSPYSFQFKKNFTVDAINNTAVENTGIWNGSFATRTITSNFPNPNPILVLLNGTWRVTDSGLTYVESKQTVNNESCFLRLDKK